MKLITLNLWGGKIHDKLLDFIEYHSRDTDIFCFQEVFESDRNTLTPKKSHTNILADLKNKLSDFDYIYSPSYYGRDFEVPVDYPLSQGPAIFWKKSLSPRQKGSIFTHRKINEIRFFPAGQPDVPRNFQYLLFDKFSVINVHGYWTPSEKFDTPERIKQSGMLIDFAKKQNLPAVIAGDFNLANDTKSVAMFVERGFRDLGKESGANTTRSTYYDIKWRATDKFADYIFVSEDLRVADFKVLQDEVSDHLPLQLEFKP